MESKQKTIEIEIPSDMELLLEKAGSLFHDCSQEDVLRSLILAGLESLDNAEDSHK